MYTHITISIHTIYKCAYMPYHICIWTAEVWRTMRQRTWLIVYGSRTVHDSMVQAYTSSPCNSMDRSVSCKHRPGQFLPRENKQRTTYTTIDKFSHDSKRHEMIDGRVLVTIGPDLACSLLRSLSFKPCMLDCWPPVTSTCGKTQVSVLPWSSEKNTKYDSRKQALSSESFGVASYLMGTSYLK